MDTNVDQVRPFDFLTRNRDDVVSSVSTKAMFYAITGSGGNLVWYSPETFRHFNENVKAQYPGQLSQLNNLFIAYLIQQP